MEKKSIRDLNRPDIEHYKRQPKMKLIVVLDNIRSLNNIGSIFRTCDAFAVESIAICGISQTPPSPEIHKTALGAENSVRWEKFENTEICIHDLQRHGYTICCLEQVKESIELQDFKPQPGRNYALILGHEVDGVDQQIVNECDICLEIPQRGTKHSLNVSVSAGIAIWHFFSHMML